MNDITPVNETPTKKSVMEILFNVFFTLMYPFITAFALVVTALVSILSYTFKAIYWFINLFKKK
jgi:hypothetical protein